MLRSMYSGVSGLRAFQTMMDVVGNNIANANTIGYKSSQTVFQDRLAQILQGAGVAPGGGGTNPSQVGLGVRVGGTPASFVQGGLQVTGRTTDLAIQGDGFFIVRDGGAQLYTRAGSFSFDSTGNLVSPQGLILQGWLADQATGAVDTGAPVEDVRIPLGQVIEPIETDTLRLGGNLPADAAVGTLISTSLNVYDQQGTAFRVSFTFEKTAADEWEVTQELDGTAFGAAQTLTFNPATGLPTPSVFAIDPSATAGVWDGDGIDVDLGAATDPDALTQFSGTNSLAALSQDGSAMGFLQSISISQNGNVTGVFSNGRTQQLAQIALASFNNPEGLERALGSTFVSTINSGLPAIGVPGDTGKGTLLGGALEGSNVDLGQEFTNLIIAQRGFQATSRVITSSDELLNDLVNLKR